MADSKVVSKVLMLVGHLEHHLVNYLVVSKVDCLVLMMENLLVDDLDDSLDVPQVVE